MKKTAVTIINIYQAVISTTLKNLLGINKFCRFSTTCSEYAKQSILQKGIVKGSYLSVVRVLKCQPFYKGN
jgi:hypothetical protein